MVILTVGKVAKCLQVPGGTIAYNKSSPQIVKQKDQCNWFQSDQSWHTFPSFDASHPIVWQCFILIVSQLIFMGLSVDICSSWQVPSGTTVYDSSPEAANKKTKISATRSM